jgi:subtilase family serine protease
MLGNIHARDVMAKTLAASGAIAFGMGALTAGAQPADAAATVSVPTVASPQTAAYVGRAPAATAMHLIVSLPLRQPAALDRLLREEIYNPASPMYRHYLSVAQFADAFGPTMSDVLTTARYFAARGLTVSGLTRNHLIVDVDGPAATVERVFHVRLGRYRHPTENRTFIAPDRRPTLDLGVPVQEIIGLDDFTLPHPKVVRGADTSFPRLGSGPGGQYVGSDMRTAYYPSGTLNGSGQSIGLMELAGYNVSDVRSFFSNHYGAPNTVDVIGVKTDGLSLSCGNGCDDSEQALDIEYAISIAPGLKSVAVYVGSSPEDVLNRQASDDSCSVISTSWGWSENFATDDAIFREFAAQGQTNLTASGDYSSLSASGPWPEEDANIIAVGGTDVSTKVAGGPWTSETGWNHSAGGPSLDPSILIPSYQKPFINATNNGSTTLRNVPDIAANADTDMEICANGGCGGGFGGTSFASPMWAGIIALANEYAAMKAKPLVGFINPAIYALASGASYDKQFHDAIKGKSGKYSATKSYDLVTGLGSPQGQRFIDALVGS